MKASFSASCSAVPQSHGINLALESSEKLCSTAAACSSGYKAEVDFHGVAVRLEAAPFQNG